MASRVAAATTATVVAATVALVGYPAPAYADDVRTAQWHLEALQVAEAHRHSLGDGVTVAVLDSGVDASHPDLRDNVLPGIDLIGRGGDGRDDPAGSGTALAGLVAGHGHVPAPPTDDTEDDAEVEAADDVPGEDDAEVEDDAAEDEAADDVPGEDVPDEEAPGEDRSAGVLGLAPAAAVLPVVVAPAGADPPAAILAAGVAEAMRHGVDVILIGRPVPDDPAVTGALGAAVAAGTAVVVPAVPAGEAEAVARYGGAGLLGAVPDDHAAPGRAGTVVAPAAGVMSAGAQGGYYRFARTADAAASGVLAGAVALVLAVDPAADGRAAVDRIVQTADGGELDLVAALTADVDPPSPSPPGAPPQPPAGEPDPGVPAPPGIEADPDPERADFVAAFDADDWRRWLVAIPLVAFGVALAGISITSARRARR